MNIFNKIGDAIKERMAEAQVKMLEAKRDREESKEFKKLVDAKTKPIRRAGYLQEAIKQAYADGKAIAAAEAAKRQAALQPEKKKELSDFAIPDMKDFFNTKPTKLKEHKK